MVTSVISTDSPTKMATPATAIPPFRTGTKSPNPTVVRVMYMYHSPSPYRQSSMLATTAPATSTSSTNSVTPTASCGREGSFVLSALRIIHSRTVRTKSSLRICPVSIGSALEITNPTSNRVGTSPVTFSISDGSISGEIRSGRLVTTIDLPRLSCWLGCSAVTATKQRLDH
eukprot:NODE_1348_length_1188_cov_43.366989_g837_i1.p2 GENE.NODE_1348_length_1188_cov_43.366989_g837_i1~~NODE_1348_length_1188_cov_43.366989_g837_i1.p2  ORF type:complete len:172 (-),score=30.13 NODE_1348_length_1188_cov_43.366989_g837_i1:366-881(-)